MADVAARGPVSTTADSRSSLHKLMQRKSTIAFLMALPLILLIAILVAMWLQRGIWGLVRSRFDVSLLSVGRRLGLKSEVGVSDHGL